MSSTVRNRDWSLGDTTVIQLVATPAELPVEFNQEFTVHASCDWWARPGNYYTFPELPSIPGSQTQMTKSDLQFSGDGLSFTFAEGFMEGLRDELRSRIESSIFLNYSPPTVEVTYLETFDRNTMVDVVTSDFYEKQARNEFTFSPMSHKHYWGKADSVVTDAVEVRILYDEGWRNTQPRPMAWYTNRIEQAYNMKPYLSPEPVGDSYPGGYTPKDMELIVSHLESTFVSAQTDSAAIALSKAKSSFTNADLDLLIALAEGPDTVKTLIKAIKLFLDIIRDVKSGKWRRYAPKLWKRIKATRKSARVFAREVDGMAQIWLELRYAVRPIVYDIIGILKILEGDKPLAEYQSYYGFHSEIVESENVSVYDDNNVDTGMRFTANTEITGKAGILAELVCNEPMLKDLGLTNIGSLIFDKLSFSFVFGWFVDVGQMLYDFNPTVVYREKGVWVTTRTSSACHVVRPLGPDIVDGSVELTLHYNNTERDVSPESRYFTLDVNLDTLKIIDLVALTKGLWLKPKS